jgi:hypothetical protein
VYTGREFIANSLHIISAGTTSINPIRDTAGNKRIHAITSYKQKIRTHEICCAWESKRKKNFSCGLCLFR